MLGQPISMLIPEVVGFEADRRPDEGTTATDLVLKVVEMLREQGVVGKFVEFYGSGLDNLPLADRATIANMAPEYGATCGFFPIDDETLRYLRNTGRDEDRIALVEAYAKENGIWRDATMHPVYTDTLELDMGTIVPGDLGPKRPQDYVALTGCAKRRLCRDMEETFKRPMGKEVAVEGEDYTMESGKVVIAAITSCTNTSNPYVMIGAGLVARKARAGPEPQAMGQDLAGPRLTGCDRLSGTARPARDLISARLQPGRLWLHHLHRQLRPDARKNSKAIPTAIWSPPRSCRATATLKAAFHPTCAPTTSPRRRWSWPMRWPAHGHRPGQPSRWVRTRTATTSI